MAYKIAIGSAVKTVNECRKQEGLIDKPGGDILRIQQQVVPLTGETNEN